MPRPTGPRGVCWQWRKGFCARGRDCIYRHEERASTRINSRICRWEYATKCHSNGTCGDKHLQLTVSEVEDRLKNWQSFRRSDGRDLSHREIAEWLRIALALFVDGDQELRYLVVSTMSSGWYLQQIKLCLYPKFLLQSYPPQINWTDHVAPVLRIMSDPVNSIHEPSMNSLRDLYDVVLDPRRRQFWDRIMKVIRGSLKLLPFRVAAQISGVIMIFLTAIKFDPKNLSNVVVRESVPLLVEFTDALQKIHENGYLSPNLADALDALERTVSGQLSVAEALNTVAERQSLCHRVSNQVSLTSRKAEDMGQATAVFDPGQQSQKPGKPLEDRLLVLAHENFMKAYLEGLENQTVTGGLISGTGFFDDIEIQPETETDDLEEELEKIPYATSHHGDKSLHTRPFGLTSTGSRKNIVKPMIFNHESGDALFERWKERASDPTKLNLDWGKNSSPNSMKDFLQLTLTLFIAASSETRLQFISEYMLKEPYLGKLWECLDIELPTDSINHPSPKYSDHVSTVIHIMSHPDVVNRREFQDVRKELSEMFAAKSNYLYGILEYMNLHSRSRAKNKEMIEDCAKSVILILEGVFKLIDPRNLTMEFRYEAKKFLVFAWSVENTRPHMERTSPLTIQTVESFIMADSKLYPETKPPQICSRRQADEAREREKLNKGIRKNGSTAQEICDDINNRFKSGNFVEPVKSYLKKSVGKSNQAPCREGDRKRAREQGEEGWDDGKPIVHRAEWVPRDGGEAPDDAEQEPEEETRPMDDEEALRFLKNSKTTAESAVLPTLPEKKPKIVNSDRTSQPETDKEGDHSGDAILEKPNDTGSLISIREPVKVKTSSKFPRKGKASEAESCREGSESDSTQSPPTEESLLQYMSNRNVPSAGQAALERLSAFDGGVRSPVREKAHQECQLEHEQVEWQSESASPGQTREAQDSRGFSNPQLSSSRAAVKFGPRPRDRATIEYYRAIHGSGHPVLQQNAIQELAAPIHRSTGESLADPPSQKGSESHGKGQDTDNVFKVTEPSYASSTCPQPREEEQQPINDIVAQGTSHPEKSTGHRVLEEAKQDHQFDSDAALVDKKRDLPLKSGCGGIQDQILDSNTWREMVPWASHSKTSSAIQSTVEAGVSSTISAPKPLPKLPIATSNEDLVGLQNDQAEAAKAERGRPIARFGNRHDQNFVPRRNSEIRRGPNDVVEYLPCGHTRGVNRNEDYCNERVNKKTPYCGHEAYVECSDPMKHWRCKAVCGQRLVCSHYCKRECFQCLEEIKIDGTPVWNHKTCESCMHIRAAAEKKKQLKEGSGRQDTVDAASQARKS